MVNKVAWGALAVCVAAVCALGHTVASLAAIALAGAFALWVVPSAPPVPLSAKHLPGKRGWLNDKYHKSKVPPQLDAIVIGSGMSGLSTAAVLARFGRRVVVLEQHDVAGGGTHTFDLSGFRFDSGLHYTVPWHGPIFQLTCLTNDVPEFELLGDGDGVFDRVVLGNDKPFDVKFGEKHLDDLRDAFPDDREGIEAYVRATDKVLHSVKLFCFSKLLPKRLQRWFWMLVPSAYYPSQETAKAVLARVIKSKKLRSLMCSLWLDTGGRPDEASLMLTGAVQRGLPKEGGCYPRGGSSAMARCLMPTILSHGGRVLVEAPVKRIVVNPNTLVAEGVEMEDGTVLRAGLVVSSTGYHNTYGTLVDESITSALNIPRQLPVKQSPGFVMCNVGINGDAKELGISSSNMWYLPVDTDGDIFPPMEKYFVEPLSNDIPCLVTWPSLKDASANTGKNRLSCQILAMADGSWFEPFKDDPFGARSVQYQELKKKWEARLLEKLFALYPQVKGKVVFADVSTPLSINHYLRAPQGAAVGLDQTPLRFGREMQEHLDTKSPVQGLWLTGQDTLICGVTLAQLAGIITACRILGFANSMKFLLQSIFML